MLDVSELVTIDVVFCMKLVVDLEEVTVSVKVLEVLNKSVAENVTLVVTVTLVAVSVALLVFVLDVMVAELTVVAVVMVSEVLEAVVFEVL
jgi:hypothetical protein